MDGRTAMCLQEQMSTDMETPDVGEAAPAAPAAPEALAVPETPQPTHIDIHIHQESALLKLLLAGCSALRLPASASTRSLDSSRLLVASWVVQIVLGVLSVVLGGILYICYFSALNGSGAPIWTGIVAMLAGTVAFLHKKRSGTFWALLRTLLVLANFCTAVAAIVLGSRDFNNFRWHFYRNICLEDSSGRWHNKPYSTPGPQEAERLGLCTSYMRMLQTLIISLQAMLLGVWVLLLLASLTPVCVYVWKRFFTKEKTDEKKLLGANVI